jgi:hypothetical protein
MLGLGVSFRGTPAGRMHDHQSLLFGIWKPRFILVHFRRSRDNIHTTGCVVLGIFFRNISQRFRVEILGTYRVIYAIITWVTIILVGIAGCAPFGALGFIYCVGNICRENAFGILATRVSINQSFCIWG